MTSLNRALTVGYTLTVYWTFERGKPLCIADILYNGRMKFSAPGDTPSEAIREVVGLFVGIEGAENENQERND